MQFDKLIQVIAYAKHFYFMSRMNDDDGDGDGRIGTYRVVVLTVPPNFQYQNEKQWAANQRICSMKFSMYKRSSLVKQRFSF